MSVPTPRRSFHPAIAVLLISVSLAACGERRETPDTPPSAEERRARQRAAMVSGQLEQRGIADPRVLAAMTAVERHRFVPPDYRDRAYGDHPLPIGHGQTISQPYMVAYMTEVLGIRPDDRVLEIGTGSGYQAAVLAEICDSVYTIEIVPELGRRAAALLDSLGYGNVAVRIGDGYRGWPERAPFDAIIVTAAPSHVPDPLRAQLTEGGRMVIPVGDRGSQELVYLVKDQGELVERAVFPVRFVPLVDSGGIRY